MVTGGPPPPCGPLEDDPATVNNLETSLPGVNNSVADISSCTVSDVYQLDGNVTFLDDSQIRQAEAEFEPNSANIIPVHNERASIPVHISRVQPKVNCNLEDRPQLENLSSQLIIL